MIRNPPDPMPRRFNRESDKIHPQLGMISVVCGNIPLIAWVVLGLCLVSTCIIWNTSDSNLH